MIHNIYIICIWTGYFAITVFLKIYLSICLDMCIPVCTWSRILLYWKASSQMQKRVFWGLAIDPEPAHLAHQPSWRSLFCSFARSGFTYTQYVSVSCWLHFDLDWNERWLLICECRHYPLRKAITWCLMLRQLLHTSLRRQHSLGLPLRSRFQQYRQYSNFKVLILTVWISSSHT